MINNQSTSCGLCCTKLEDFGVRAGGDVLLHDINLHIHCGELTALVGPNGAGKTTLMKAILGEIPFSGSLRYVDASGSQANQPVIGYVPQYLDFDKGAPVSVLDLAAACISRLPVWLVHSKALRERVRHNLAEVKADHLISRKIGELSGGELQRILLACALDPIPDLLLLDEPVSGVDPRGMELFYNMVSDLRRRYDLSIILVSHDLDLVSRFADRVVFLNKTVLAVGPPNEVVRGEMFLKTFGPGPASYPWRDQPMPAIHHLRESRT